MVSYHQLAMSGSVNFSKFAQSSEAAAAKVWAACTQGIDKERMVGAYAEWASTYDQVRKNSLGISTLGRVTKAHYMNFILEL